MFKNLIVAVGLLMGLTLTGCNLYFEDQSSPPQVEPPGGGPGEPRPYECANDAECAAGCYCDKGACVEGGFCDDDRDCGDGLTCDEARNSCDPQGGGTCGGEVTCIEARPNCPADTVPLVENGCWTGACQVLAECDANPPCDRLNTEASCLARASECSPSYNGINCRPTDGSGGSCEANGANCTCDSYVFDECRAN
ncbi:MAG: hypothetical protein R3B48_20150 [Kofleriaceae bacterium]